MHSGPDRYPQPCAAELRSMALRLNARVREAVSGCSYIAPTHSLDDGSSCALVSPRAVSFKCIHIPRMSQNLQNKLHLVRFLNGFSSDPQGYQNQLRVTHHLAILTKLFVIWQTSFLTMRTIECIPFKVHNLLMLVSLIFCKSNTSVLRETKTKIRETCTSQKDSL